ncbi:expressed unknown protein [Seminavis robusta]|uniref:Secreted protein n=1 Tax=Seminavis robusta TaxID=568900 RepID=A0A9N8ESD6_9STRA|nr:expressed unknown protein [Seminavis robusta]|eukprot:Sro1642_g288020.1 n/a (175) ;mRNA; f:9304-9828
MKTLFLAVALVLVQQPLPAAAFTAPAGVAPSSSFPCLPMHVDGWNDWMLDDGAQAHDFDRMPYPRRQQELYLRKEIQPHYEFDYENSMDKQEDLWLQQQAHENFVDNPYGSSGYGQYHRDRAGFDEYDRENLQREIMPRRQPRGMDKQGEVARKQYANDAFISNPYGNRRGPSW